MGKEEICTEGEIYTGGERWGLYLQGGRESVLVVREGLCTEKELGGGLF